MGPDTMRCDKCGWAHNLVSGKCGTGVPPDSMSDGNAREADHTCSRGTPERTEP